jgi:hypothetical protein
MNARSKYKWGILEPRKCAHCHREFQVPHYILKAPGRGRFCSNACSNRGRILPAVKRFWKYVTKRDNGCWEWTGSRDRLGYGLFSDEGRAYKFSYELHNGTVPDGFELDHLCRNSSCVNPDHLEAVTHRVNVLRGTSPWAVNARKTSCKHGHPFNADNTYAYRGARRCRECTRRQQREYQKRKRNGGA